MTRLPLDVPPSHSLCHRNELGNGKQSRSIFSLLFRSQAVPNQIPKPSTQNTNSAGYRAPTPPPPKAQKRNLGFENFGGRRIFCFLEWSNLPHHPLLCRCYQWVAKREKGRNWTAQMARSWKPTRWMNPPTWERAQAGPTEREAEDVGLECCSPRRRRRRP